MDENTAVIISACITAFVTISGFIVTYFLNKRNFKEEINKQKVNINLDKIADLPYKIQNLMDTMLDKKNDRAMVSAFKDLVSLIFAYGSKEAIKIVTSMQEMNYLVAANPESVDKNTVMVYYILLLCQVKYDLTGIEINPEYWYRMRLTDYTKMKDFLDQENNKIVKRLVLHEFLYIH